MNKILIALFCVFCFLPVGVDAEELAVKYYATNQELTYEMFPEIEWPYVTYVNDLEPKEVVADFLWVDYNANSLIVAGTNTLTDEQNCIIFYFLDVTVASRDNWRDADVYHVEPLLCETVNGVLEDSLKPKQ